ncbi:unnamed protein product [Microthlaspi erraticum]|uniref:Uncharacterized protein n=1 Tax=Microthlaspi erraticum TaxID=1685480 RepID=A0A6D2HPZ7_9BRAS|nr:unnamed protein product [Microthlaspi erraticum]
MPLSVIRKGVLKNKRRSTSSNQESHNISTIEKLAPLGTDISGPELVAPVANAGGIGLLRCLDWERPYYLVIPVETA